MYSLAFFSKSFKKYSIFPFYLAAPVLLPPLLWSRILKSHNFVIGSLRISHYVLNSPHFPVFLCLSFTLASFPQNITAKTKQQKSPLCSSAFASITSSFGFVAVGVLSPVHFVSVTANHCNQLLSCFKVSALSPSLDPHQNSSSISRNRPSHGNSVAIFPQDQSLHILQ